MPSPVCSVRRPPALLLLVLCLSGLTWKVLGGSGLGRSRFPAACRRILPSGSTGKAPAQTARSQTGVFGAVGGMQQAGRAFPISNGLEGPRFATEN